MMFKKRRISFLAVLLTFVPVFLLATTVTAAPLFYDGFNEVALDASKWNVLEGAPAIAMVDSYLFMEGEPAMKRIDSFDTFQPMGNTLFASARIQLNGEGQKFGFRINAGEFPGPVSGIYFDTQAGPADTVTALVQEVSDTGTVTTILTVPIDVTWGEFHLFSIEWSDDDVAFYVDGDEKARIAFVYMNALPIGIWNDGLPLMQTGWVQVIQLIDVSVSVDIKPGSEVNSINPRSKGVLPVALLTTETFDAMAVDPETVVFGAEGVVTPPAHYAVEDVNGDGADDYIFQFPTQLTGITCDTVFATLTGEAITGTVEGTDSVRPVGCQAATDGTPPGQLKKAEKSGPPAFEDHPVHDSKPGKDNHPTPNSPGHNK